jgi:hypothetical protein
MHMLDSMPADVELKLPEAVMPILENLPLAVIVIFALVEYFGLFESACPWRNNMR